MGERVTVGNEEVVIDPLVLFERALVIADISDITKKEIFETEISLYPPSLFGNNGLLRSPDNKANLTDYIALECKPLSSSDDKNKLQIERSVLDIGSLLRTKVCFKKSDTYGEIIESMLI